MQAYANQIRQLGIEVVEVNPDSLVVQEPSVCMSGSRKWMEYNTVVLKSQKEIVNFILDIS